MNIKDVLDNLYADYRHKERISFDPIDFPHRYKDPQDKEIVAFISTCFAYGQVGVFKTALEKIFNICGTNPFDFVACFDVRRQGQLFEGINYRFNNAKDIIALFNTLSKVLSNYGSLKKVFMASYRAEDPNILPALGNFVDRILSISTAHIYVEDIRPTGYKQFFPSPVDGSPCKRMNLFLRWMVRDRDVDFGLWREIPKNKLIIPLDTHIARISRCLGLSARRSADMKMALEITEALKNLDPQDPVKYDFALCHQGISRLCTTENCNSCKFRVV